MKNIIPSIFLVSLFFLLYLSCERVTDISGILKNKRNGNNPLGNVGNTEMVLSVTQGIYDDKIILTWTKIPGAVRYDIGFSVSQTANLDLRSDFVADAEFSGTTVTYEHAFFNGEKESFYYKVAAIGENEQKLLSSSIVFGSTLGFASVNFDNIDFYTTTLLWNKVANAVGYTIQRRTSAGIFETIAELEEDVFSYVDTSLDSETTYLYRILAHSSLEDEFAAGTERSLTTPAKDAPFAPESFTVSDKSFGNKIVIEWQPPLTTDSSPETDPLFYAVYRKEVQESEFTLLAVGASTDEWEVPGSVPALFRYEDTTVVSDLRYHYQVCAAYPTEDGAKKTWGISVEAEGETVPSIKGWSIEEAESDSGFNDIVLSWDQDPTLGADVEIWRSARIPTDDQFTLLASLEDSGEFADDSIAFAETYYYKARYSVGDELDEKGLFTDILEITFVDESITTADMGLFVDSIATSSVFIGWSNLSESGIDTSITNSAELMGVYTLQELTDAGYSDIAVTAMSVNVDGAIVAEVLTSVFAAATYRIKAFLPSGDTIISNDSISAAPLKKPANPVAAQGTYKDRIQVAWNAVPGADSYKIYSRIIGDSAWTEEEKILLEEEVVGFEEVTGEVTFDILPANNNNADERGKIHEIKVVAMSGGNASSESDTVTGNVLGPALLNPEATQLDHIDKVVLSWDKVVGVKTYLIERDDGEGGAFGELVTINDEDSVFFEDTTVDLLSSKPYRYRITPLNVKTYNNLPSIVKTGYILAPPDGVTATEYKYADSIKVSWNEVSGALQYRIYARSLGGSDWYHVGDTIQKSGSTEAPSEYIHTGLPAGVAREYAVCTAIAGMDSGKSAAVTGKTLPTVSGVAVSKGIEYQSGGRYATKITWNGVSGAVKYFVFRMDRNMDFLDGSYWVKVGEADHTGLERYEWLDTDGVILRETYHAYWVVAVGSDEAGDDFVDASLSGDSTTWRGDKDFYPDNVNVIESDSFSTLALNENVDYGYRWMTVREVLNQINYALHTAAVLTDSSKTEYRRYTAAVTGGSISDNSKGGFFAFRIDSYSTDEIPNIVVNDTNYAGVSGWLRANKSGFMVGDSWDIAKKDGSRIVEASIRNYNGVQNKLVDFQIISEPSLGGISSSQGFKIKIEGGSWENFTGSDNVGTASRSNPHVQAFYGDSYSAILAQLYGAGVY